jgi:hypothetical protein
MPFEAYRRPAGKAVSKSLRGWSKVDNGLELLQGD